ncbi:MAG: twin-arginine translocation signal domain-containing protein [Candidatus Entotheonellia bacterium]
MDHEQDRIWSRREFLGKLTLAGTAGFLSLYPKPIAAEPPPETTTLRLMEAPALCNAPEYVAEALFPSEGFSAVRYVKTGGGAGTMKALASGDIDLAKATDLCASAPDQAARTLVDRGFT